MYVHVKSFFFKYEGESHLYIGTLHLYTYSWIGRHY